MAEAGGHPSPVWEVGAKSPGTSRYPHPAGRGLVVGQCYADGVCGVGQAGQLKWFRTPPVASSEGTGPAAAGLSPAHWAGQQMQEHQGGCLGQGLCCGFAARFLVFAILWGI